MFYSYLVSSYNFRAFFLPFFLSFRLQEKSVVPSDLLLALLFPAFTGAQCTTWGLAACKND